MKKKLCNLIVILTIFLGINVVNASDSILYTYQIDCSKFAPINYTPVETSSNIYVKKDNNGKRYIQVNDGSIINSSTNDFQTICKYTSSGNSSDLNVNLSLLVEKINDLGSGGLYIIGSSDDPTKNPLKFYAAPESWYKVDTETVMVNKASQSSYDPIWDSTLWKYGKKVGLYGLFKKIDNRELQTVCRFDVYGGFIDVNYYTNTDYEIVPSINIGTVLVTGDFNGTKSTFQGTILDDLKNNSCSKNVKLCNYIDEGPYGQLKKYYLSNDSKDSNCMGINGEIYYDNTFKEYLGGLKSPLSIYAPKALEYTLTVGGQATTLNNIDANDKFCTSTECSSNAEQYTITAIEKIKKYCSSVYRYESNNTVKKAECSSFTNFLNDLVNDGVLRLDDISTGCGFVTGGLFKEINKIFNIIKVAGPLLAVLLGMIDFTKAVASGDADKEMKDASKRFIRRLIAAALLFIIPTLLAFLINIFIGDKLGEDVYCDLFDKTISNGRPTGGNINHGTSTGSTSGGTSSGSSGGISSPNIDRLD